MGQQGLGEAVDPLWNQERHQGIGRADTVPQRECRIVDPAGGLDHLARRSPHPPVRIGDVAGVQECVVEGRVEDPLLPNWPFNLRAVQQPLPRRIRRAPSGVEAQSAVRLQIAPCAGDIDGGEGDAGFQFSAAPEVEIQEIPRRLFARLCGQGGDPRDRMVELQDKGRLPVGPVAHAVAPADLALRRIDPDVGVDDPWPLEEADHVLHVDQRLRLPCAGKAVAVIRDRPR